MFQFKKNKNQNFGHRRSRSRSPVFELVRDLYVINTWFKFEGKIPNDSEVIMFTRNHTYDDDDDGTKN